MGGPSRVGVPCGLQLAGLAEGQDRTTVLAMAPANVALALARATSFIGNMDVVGRAVGVEDLLDFVGGAEVGRDRPDAVIVPAAPDADGQDDEGIVGAGGQRQADGTDGLARRAGFGYGCHALTLLQWGPRAGVSCDHRRPNLSLI